MSNKTRSYSEREKRKCRNKKTYSNIGDAKTALDKFFKNNKTILEPYRCEYCKKIHLTKLEQYNFKSISFFSEHNKKTKLEFRVINIDINTGCFFYKKCKNLKSFKENLVPFDMSPHEICSTIKMIENDEKHQDVYDFLKELLNQSDSTQLEWLDIESAPKDGTNILITNKANDTFVCHYREGFWYSDFYDGYDYGYLFYEPTHWRPLPKLPEGNGGNNE